MKQISIFIFICLFLISKVIADDQIDFIKWKKNFKDLALKNNISEITFDTVMKNVRFLPKVIEYDRYQPEFYEDTKTYISKRASKKKVKSGIDFYKKNSILIHEVEERFNIEKELLLSLMGLKLIMALMLVKWIFYHR